MTSIDRMHDLATHPIRVGFLDEGWSVAVGPCRGHGPGDFDRCTAAGEAARRTSHVHVRVERGVVVAVRLARLGEGGLP